MNSPQVSQDAVDRSIKLARRDGMFAAATSGLAGALIGSNLLGFTKNKSIFCGVLTGLLSGYFFTQAFTSSNMARLKTQAQEPHSQTFA